MKQTVSIAAVVPVYNAEKYLAASLDSLISQGEALTQIIIVNDGSTDDSPDILTRFAERDERIEILHKPNEGVGKARRDGVARCTSTYTLFVDSDDRLVEGAVDLIAADLFNHAPDLLQFGYLTGPDGNEKQHLPESVHCDRDTFREEHIDRLLNTPARLVVLWDKVYRTDLLRSGVSDWGNRLFEDYLLNMQYFRYVNCFRSIPQALYRYRTYKSSLSRTFNTCAFDDLVNVQRIKSGLFNEMGLDSEYDRQRSAKWFLHFLYNISLTMFSYANTLSWNNKKHKLIKMWEHPVTKEIATGSDHPLACDIAAGRVHRTMRKLLVKAWLIKFKRLIKRILNR